MVSHGVLLQIMAQLVQRHTLLAAAELIYMSANAAEGEGLISPGAQRATGWGSNEALIHPAASF
jgi:hypothetical protein